RFPCTLSTLDRTDIVKCGTLDVRRRRIVHRAQGQRDDRVITAIGDETSKRFRDVCGNGDRKPTGSRRRFPREESHTAPFCWRTCVSTAIPACHTARRLTRRGRWLRTAGPAVSLLIAIPTHCQGVCHVSTRYGPELALRCARLASGVDRQRPVCRCVR